MSRPILIKANLCPQNLCNICHKHLLYGPVYYKKGNGASHEECYNKRQQQLNAARIIPERKTLNPPPYLTEAEVEKATTILNTKILSNNCEICERTIMRNMIEVDGIRYHQKCYDDSLNK